MLHLVDPCSPWAGPGALRLLGDLVASNTGNGLDGQDAFDATTHDVLIIGRSEEERLARSCGLQPLGSIWPRGGHVLSATAALRRWLAAARSAAAMPDVAHAWSAGTGALSAMAAPALPRVVTPMPAAVAVDSPHLVDRETVRRRWLRDDGVQPDEFVIGLLGEHVAHFDARQAMHVGARTGLSSRRVRLVMSGRSLGRAAAQRFLAAIDLDRSIVQDEGVAEPWRVLRGLDAALLLAPVSSGERRSRKGGESSLSVLPLLWAWAAGVPVIAEESAPLCGLLEHGVNGLSFPAGDLNTACDRVARLHDDRALAQRLVDAGRKVARQRFDVQEFCRRVYEAYRRAGDRGGVAYLSLDARGS